MSCSKEKEVWLCLIDMYKNMPHLWQKEHQQYMNKDMRAQGFRDLLEVYKNFNENATEKTVKKKIENMRTNYVKELKKVMVSKRPGVDEEYVPSLWYFDALSFLGGRTESGCTVTGSFENVNSTSDDETASAAKLQKRKKPDTQLLQKPEIKVLSAEKTFVKRDEEWEVYGRSIGFQMRDLKKRQLTIAQKMISDVLYHAKLDQLSESSSVVVRPPNESMSNNIGFYQRQNHHSFSPAPPSNYSSPSPSHQIQSPDHSSSHYTVWPRFHTQSVSQAQLSNSPTPHPSLPNAQVQITQTVHQHLQSQHQMQLSNLSAAHQPISKGQVHHSIHPLSPDVQANHLSHHESPSQNDLAQAQPSHETQKLPSDGVIVVKSETSIDFYPNDNSLDGNLPSPKTELFEKDDEEF